LEQVNPDLEHPLEAYVESVLFEATKDLDCAVAFSHTQPFIPIQKIAQVAGLARLAKTNLCIHPTYGPWFSLRAVIYLTESFNIQNSAIHDPCDGCLCGVQLELAWQNSKDWKRWLAMRDACVVGRAYRYSDDQIAYHYTKDKAILRRPDSDR
jgi:methylmalonic aciduria homocystinuria type C protein